MSILKKIEDECIFYARPTDDWKQLKICGYSEHLEQLDLGKDDILELVKELIEIHGKLKSDS
jgi:hypothetical protein